MGVDELRTLLRKVNIYSGKIKNIVVEARNKSGRVTKLKINDGGKEPVYISGKELRTALGPKELRSTNSVL